MCSQSTANQVQMFMGMARTGKRVLRAQIVKIGLTRRSITIKIASNAILR
jgi:hypothetical protein